MLKCSPLCQLAFFNDNKDALYSIFIKYAMGDAPSGQASWQSISDSLSTMSEKEFTKVPRQGGARGCSCHTAVESRVARDGGHGSVCR